MWDKQSIIVQDGGFCPPVPSQCLTMIWNINLNSCFLNNSANYYLTHWGRVTHICVSKLTIIASDNGLSPDRRQAIIWTNAGILLIGPLGTNFNEILIKFHIFSFNKMHLKMSSGKWRPSCLGLNVLNALCTDLQLGGECIHIILARLRFHLIFYL